MIFVTVGTQLAYPRLLNAMNKIAVEIDEEVVAQCGTISPEWANMQCYESLTPEEFNRFTDRARLIVAHAGIGTILTAKKLGLPLIVMPRRFAFDEHRNDHQLATAQYVQSLQGVYVAWSEEELEPLIRAKPLIGATSTPGPTHTALIDRVKSFIDQ